MFQQSSSSDQLNLMCAAGRGLFRKQSKWPAITVGCESLCGHFVEVFLVQWENPLEVVGCGGIKTVLLHHKKARKRTLEQVTAKLINRAKSSFRRSINNNLYKMRHWYQVYQHIKWTIFLYLTKSSIFSKDVFWVLPHRFFFFFK